MLADEVSIEVGTILNAACGKMGWSSKGFFQKISWCLTIQLMK